MSANPAEPVIAAHIKVGKDGRRISAAGRAQMVENSKIGRKAIQETFAARRQALAAQDSPQPIEHQYKPFALALVPGILKRWGKGAMGKIKGWPATAQLEAGKMILGVAGIALESRAADSGPLSEMTLQELHDSLAESLESAKNLIAIEGMAAQVIDNADPECPNQCNSEESAVPSAPIEDAPGAEAPPADGAT